MNILEQIAVNSQKELAEIKKRVPLRDLEKSHYFSRAGISLSENILNPEKTGIIAEFKRRSPSSGIINSDARIEEVTIGYSSLGASGLSILTEKKYFGGDVNDLRIARKLNSVPILRKDFIIDDYQVIESKAIGADAILLIASLLTGSQILKMASLARSVGLQVVLEVHNEDELVKLNEFIDIAGVNNRNLRTFKVDTELSLKMAEKIPAGFVKISESGISSSDTINILKQAGYDGFLIGERFMHSGDPVKSFSGFIKTLRKDYAED
ncbi:MAG: indole-3-glycerol phosphate synthase TrpC [Bacteroidales bacterium]|nr:indole-3-glycerol phosphate synthase TrpC [Bacteroidales bacterium]